MPKRLEDISGWAEVKVLIDRELPESFNNHFVHAQDMEALFAFILLQEEQLELYRKSENTTD